MNSLKSYMTLAAIATTIGLGFHSCSYVDYPGYGKHTASGRTKNSVATIVTSAIAQQMYPQQDATINVAVQKPLYADVQITGQKTPTSLETKADLTFAHNDMHANIVREQLMGLIAKSEFDWQIKQVDKTKYHVSRANFKFDTTLDLKVENGNITGTYSHPLAFNWNITGTYTKEGHINVTIDVPFSTANMTLEGKIARK